MEKYDILAERLIFTSSEECGLSDAIEYLKEAESDICLYLHRKAPLSSLFDSKIISLAKIKIKKERAKSGIKSSSYTEGSVSKSESYTTFQEYEAQETALLKSLDTYRRGHIVK